VKSTLAAIRMPSTRDNTDGGYASISPAQSAASSTSPGPFGRIHPPVRDSPPEYGADPTQKRYSKNWQKVGIGTSSGTGSSVSGRGTSGGFTSKYVGPPARETPKVALATATTPAAFSTRAVA
jgi:hypothetical protein